MDTPRTMLAEPRSETAAGLTVLVVGTERGRILGRAFGGYGEQIVETADRPAIRVLPGESNRPGLLRRAVERVVF